MFKKRHTLVEMTDKGREWSFEQIKKSGEYENLEQISRLVLLSIDGIKIPGIMRRDENEEAASQLLGAVPVGFASPLLYKGSRLRIPAYVQKSEITRLITPFEVLRKDFAPRNKCLKVLQEIIKTAQDLDIRLGVWGSVGLEIYTTLPYSHDYSDIDLLMETKGCRKTKEFFDTIQEKAKQKACKIDLEMELPNGYGIKVAELFTASDDVLGKGINDVIFISKQTLGESVLTD